MQHSKRLGVLIAVSVLVLWTVQGLAFPGADGCRTCHPGFTNGGPGTGPGPLHSQHVGATQMTNTCQLCHMDFTFTVPDINESGAPGGLSCIGCHMSPGLWQHHQGASISCAPCHTSWPTPAPENTLPPYYSRTDVALSNPCATDTGVGGEDYSGDQQGLDNDGDGLYDGDDSDCTNVPVTKPTWGGIKALYGE